jgi:hypothetical protein
MKFSYDQVHRILKVVARWRRGVITAEELLDTLKTIFVE